MSSLVSQLVKETIRDFQASNVTVTPRSINGGLCRYFAKALSVKLTRAGIEHQVVDDRCFRVPDEYDEGIFDTALFAEYWPDVKIPETLSDCNHKWIYDCCHAWVVVGLTHYDSESPDGVLNFFDLQIFQRIAQGIRDPEFEI